MESNSERDQPLAGRYQISGRLGAGSSADVFRAVDEIGRSYAIKVFRPQPDLDAGAALDPEVEARLVASLDHPGIVRIHDTGSLGRQHFLVMEHLEGPSLRELLGGERAIHHEVAVRLFAQVASALAHVHARGIVHRDIKPGNILLSAHAKERHIAKLIDFGLASTPMVPSRRELAVGTPGYISPEQVRGLESDARSDIYSLGAVMFRALTGHRPFQGTTTEEVMSAHVSAPLPRFRHAAPHLRIPPELEAVVRRCMAKRPSDRFATADELVAALVAIRDGGYEAPGLSGRHVLSHALSELRQEPVLLVSAVTVGLLLGLLALLM